MLIRPKKKKDKLFLMLLEVSNNLKESVHYFVDFKINTEDDLVIFQENMRTYEHKGDDLVAKIIMELNDSFITPIEREDALALATNMDRILDKLKQCAVHFYMFNIFEIDEYMQAFSQLLKKCVDEIDKAVELISFKRLTDIRQHTKQIKQYERQCDDLEKKAIMNLFKNPTDVIKLIQYKEIYETFEGTVDVCQKVGKVLDTVVMKNA